MGDRRRAQIEFIASLMAFDRAAERAGPTERVLPADVDLDVELAGLCDALATPSERPGERAGARAGERPPLRRAV